MKMPDAVRAAIRDAKSPTLPAPTAGLPHLAVSKLIRVLDAEHVTFTGWFCPQTAENIAKNPKIAVSVWDATHDHGYQLVGEVTKATVTAVLDGGTARARIRSDPAGGTPADGAVQAVLELTSGTHSDKSI